MVNCEDLEVDTNYIAMLDGWLMNPFDSVAVCKCGNTIEPDGHQCPECGSLNPFLTCGLI